LRTSLEFCASIVQAVVCRPFLMPLLLSRLNPSPNAVRSRNPSKSTLAHDAVAAAVSHKHHSIIRVGAGLIQFVYGPHSHLATELILHKILFPQFFSRNFVGTNIDGDNDSPNHRRLLFEPSKSQPSSSGQV